MSNIIENIFVAVDEIKKNSTKMKVEHKKNIAVAAVLRNINP